MSHETADIRPTTLLALAFVFAAIVVVAAVDVFLDRPEAWLSVHILLELGIVLLGLGAAAYLFTGWLRATRSLAEARSALWQKRAERDAWRDRAREALQALSEAIHDQFRDWQLTPAETETALLLLKGYSHKRIAREANRSERTVRQHAVAVYRKAELGGRAELSGFFLEGLGLPTPEEEAPPDRMPGGANAGE